MNSLIYIKDLLYKHRFKYLGGILCLLVVDGLQLVLPLVLGRITDLLKNGTLTRRELVQYALIVLLIAVGIAAFRFFWRYLVFGAAKAVEAAFRHRFYEHLQRLSVNYYNHHKTGDLMSHATNDIDNIRMALSQGFVMAVDSALIPIVAVIMMFKTVGFGLTLASFAPLLALGAIIAGNVKVMHERIQKMQEAISNLTETARENFSGIRVVKSFVQEQKEIEKFRKANSHNREMNLRFVRIMSLLFPLIMGVSSLSFAIALWFGGIEVINRHITLGDFVAFNSYLGMLIWPIAALGWITSMFERGSVSLKRVNAIMDEKPDIGEAQDLAQLTGLQGKITFKNLSFTYPGSGKKTLKDINITVEPGKTLAIVGRTGSGKTTLINLLPRLYNVEEGTLLIDDTDISRIPLSTLRNSIGYVPQDSFLFSSTIRENIDFFSGKDDEHICRMAKIAQVYDNIMEFPQRFETMVGERGVTLSGGQKQRIAIARAILREPPILILDDCLSAVDTHTEEAILKGLKEVMRQRTSIIVSHRISTIKDADEIIVLEDGEIVERGPHDSLLALEGIYYDLYQKQLLSEQLEVEE